VGVTKSSSRKNRLKPLQARIKYAGTRYFLGMYASEAAAASAYDWAARLIADGRPINGDAGGVPLSEPPRTRDAAQLVKDLAAARARKPALPPASETTLRNCTWVPSHVVSEAPLPLPTVHGHVIAIAAQPHGNDAMTASRRKHARPCADPLPASVAAADETMPAVAIPGGLVDVSATPSPAPAPPAQAEQAAL